MALPNVNPTPGRNVNSSALNTTDDKEYLFLPAGLPAKTTICSIMTVICIVGAIGNLSLILFINRLERRIGHRVADFINLYFFLRSLAISDVIASLAAPLLWVQFFYDIFEAGWPCRIRRYSAIVVHAVTIYNLVVVAFERYNCICRATVKLSRARVSQLIKAAWLFGFLVTLLPIFSYQGIRTDLNETHYTITCGRDRSHTPYVVMFQIFLVMTYILPLAFLIVSSYRVLQVVRAQAEYRVGLPNSTVPERVRLQKQKQKKATRILVILIAAFVAPYLGFVGYNTFKSIARSSVDFKTDFILRYAATLLAYLNSPVNFCIHLVQLPAFRAEWSRRLDYFKRPLRLGVFTTKRIHAVSGVRTESRPQNTRRLSCPNVKKTTVEAPCCRRYSN